MCAVCGVVWGVVYSVWCGMGVVYGVVCLEWGVYGVWCGVCVSSPSQQLESCAWSWQVGTHMSSNFTVCPSVP
jgi:hypothetical protein